MAALTGRTIAARSLSRLSSYLSATAVLVFLLGMTASLTIFTVASRSDEQKRQADLDSLAVDRFNAVRAILDAQFSQLHSLHAFFKTNTGVTKSDFDEFARQLLVRNVGLHALEWIPRVTDAERAEYETRARANGLEEFTIRELDGVGQMRPASTRPEYFPVYYVQPLEANVRAVGFDLASDSARLAAIQVARDTRKTSVTGRITLVQEEGSQRAVLALLPVFRENESFKGLVLGVLRIGTLLETAVSQLQLRSVVITLDDITDDTKVVRLAGFPDLAGAESGQTGRVPGADPKMFRSEVLQVADRKWLIGCWPLTTSSVIRPSMFPVVSLLIGVLVSAVASGSIIHRDSVQDRFKRHQAELVHLSRVAITGDLATSLAHELNQPLCAIVLNAQTARRVAEAEFGAAGTVQSALDQIVRDGERAGAIIQNLRSFLHKGDIDRRRVSMERIVREAVGLIRATDSADEPVEMHLDPSLPDVMADPVQIQQVIVNLVRNGLESMQDFDSHGGSVIVRTELDEEGMVVVTVADSGSGLNGLTNEQLFSSFFTTKDQGMGVGLSISRSIIEAHSGRIWAVRSDGPGASFGFSLPAVEES